MRSQRAVSAQRLSPGRSVPVEGKLDRWRMMRRHLHPQGGRHAHENESLDGYSVVGVCGGRRARVRGSHGRQANRSRGASAATSFSGSATIHCAGGGSGTVSASGFLSGSQTITKATGSPKTVNNGIFVEVDSYSNTCTGATLGFADGGIANGFTPPSVRLNSAQVAGTTTVQDFSTMARTRSRSTSTSSSKARARSPPRSPRPPPRPKAR